MNTYFSQGSAATDMRGCDNFNSNFLHRSLMNLTVNQNWSTFVEVIARQSWPGTFDTPCIRYSTYVWIVHTPAIFNSTYTSLRSQWLRGVFTCFAYSFGFCLAGLSLQVRPGPNWSSTEDLWRSLYTRRIAFFLVSQTVMESCHRIQSGRICTNESQRKSTCK